MTATHRGTIAAPDREDLMRALLLLALVACSDDGGTPVDAAVQGDGALDAAGGLATTCTGACRTTALAATFGATTRTLDVAYFGVTTAGGTQSLYVEAYGGAAAGCPTMSSPTPDYTLIFGSVPMPTSTAVLTSVANLIDFQGDLLPSPAPVRATVVTLTPVAKNTMELALDADLTFGSGTLAGHLYATHCDSLDDTQ
ncbi:MAG: hypothetical protein ACKV2T_39230 [Kofleriaceae bacterium]